MIRSRATASLARPTLRWGLGGLLLWVLALGPWIPLAVAAPMHAAAQAMAVEAAEPPPCHAAAPAVPAPEAVSLTSGCCDGDGCCFDQACPVGHCSLPSAPALPGVAPSTAVTEARLPSPPSPIALVPEGPPGQLLRPPIA